MNRSVLFVVATTVLALQGCAALDEDDGDVEESDVEMGSELKRPPAAQTVNARAAQLPSIMEARLKVSNKPVTVRAAYVLPSWQQTSDWQTNLCHSDARRFTITVSIGKVTKTSIQVRSVKIAYQDPLGPASLTVWDSAQKHRFDRSTIDFINADPAQLGGRDPGDSDPFSVNQTFNVQPNGDGVNVEFHFYDSLALLEAGGLSCNRAVSLQFHVSK